jgi:hypothetical protein
MANKCLSLNVQNSHEIPIYAKNFECSQMTEITSSKSIKSHKKYSKSFHWRWDVKCHILTWFMSPYTYILWPSIWVSTAPGFSKRSSKRDFKGPEMCKSTSAVTRTTLKLKSRTFVLDTVKQLAVPAVKLLRFHFFFIYSTFRHFIYTFRGRRSLFRYLFHILNILKCSRKSTFKHRIPKSLPFIFSIFF